MGIEKKAAALAWEPGRDDAPRLIAAGKGPLADRILSLAEEAGIPVLEDHPLAEPLQSLEPGCEIPPELYRLAAEVYLFLAELDRSGHIGCPEHPGEEPR